MHATRPGERGARVTHRGVRACAAANAVRAPPVPCERAPPPSVPVTVCGNFVRLQQLSASVPTHGGRVAPTVPGERGARHAVPQVHDRGAGVRIARLQPGSAAAGALLGCGKPASVRPTPGATSGRGRIGAVSSPPPVGQSSSQQKGRSPQHEGVLFPQQGRGEPARARRAACAYSSV